MRSLQQPSDAYLWIKSLKSINQSYLHPFQQASSGEESVPAVPAPLLISLLNRSSGLTPPQTSSYLSCQRPPSCQIQLYLSPHLPRTEISIWRCSSFPPAWFTFSLHSPPSSTTRPSCRFHFPHFRMLFQASVLRCVSLASSLDDLPSPKDLNVMTPPPSHPHISNFVFDLLHLPTEYIPKKPIRDFSPQTCASSSFPNHSQWLLHFPSCFG